LPARKKKEQIMSNPPGSPIWYELMTPDPDGAKRFYDDVIGWAIEAAPSGPMDYRMIAAPGGLAGGVFRLTDDMQAGGARPAWLLYLGVTDVDATAGRAASLGARIFVPPTDIPGIGRFALMADPQGAPFYIMHTGRDETSTVFAPGVPGRCSWNELCTPNLPGALAFYGDLFGWENRETMDMGPMGGYHFLDLGDMRLGATVEMKDRPAHWNLYFNVPDMAEAIERVRAGGGSIEMGPHDVPSGDCIVLATDPQTARFALVARAKA
jgi:predicted enzyme related to lactoylglutathione lyase